MISALRIISRHQQEIEKRLVRDGLLLTYRRSKVLSSSGANNEIIIITTTYLVVVGIIIKLVFCFIRKKYDNKFRISILFFGFGQSFRRIFISGLGTTVA
jgi:hypothetical protein